LAGPFGAFAPLSAQGELRTEPAAIIPSKAGNLIVLRGRPAHAAASSVLSLSSVVKKFVSIAENLAVIHERIADAKHRAGRSADEIALMAVSKTQPPERIREAYAAGQRLFGENRVQEFAEKACALAEMRDAEWHMIGHLQTNKAVRAAELFTAMDSVDSVKLAEKLDTAARKLGKKLRVLIEINVGGEAAKSGVAQDSRELEELLIAVLRFEALEFRGLMTVPPFTDDPKDARPFFRQLRELRDAIAARKLPGVSMDELSMGMSHDFEVAIEEGSTCVRVGTAIFGARLRT
jgi:pyridoxal phosphate enzyme (YggS family)